MFQQFFKRNYLLQIILVCLCGTFLWLKGFLLPLPIAEPVGFSPLYELLYSFLSGHARLSSLLGLLLVLGQAFLLNGMFTRNSLLDKTTLLGAFLFVVLMATDLESLTLTPFLCAGFFLIFSLRKLFSCMDKTESLSEIFAAAFFVSIASLFYLPCIIYGFFILIALLIFKVYHWREWFVSFLGIIAPFVIVFTCFFWTDELGAKFNQIGTGFKTFPLFYQKITLVHGFYLLVIFFLFILSLGTFVRNLSSKTIFFRKKSALLLYFGLFSFVPYFYIGFAPAGGIFFAITLSFLLAQFFLEKKYKLIYYDIFFLLLLISTFLNVYF